MRGRVVTRSLYQVALAAAFAAAVIDTAHAQEPSLNALLVTAQADAPRGSPPGGAAGVEWLRGVGALSGVHMGGHSGGLDQTWWAYGRLGGFTRRHGLVFTGVGDVGRWNAPAAPSPYWRYSVGATAPLRSAAALDAEFQQFSASSLRQQLFRVGGSVPVGPAVEVKASYFLITSGGAVSPALSLRGDIRMNDRRILMGATLSRHAVAQPLLSSGGVPLRTSQEWFAGWMTPVRTSTIVTTVSLLRSDVSRVLRAQVALRIPLESKP